MNAPEQFFERAAPTYAAPDQFTRFVTNAVRVTSPDDFVALVKRDLQAIFPHGMFLAGIGHATIDGIVVERAIGINYPPVYLDKVRRQRIWGGRSWRTGSRPISRSCLILMVRHFRFRRRG